MQERSDAAAGSEVDQKLRARANELAKRLERYRTSYYAGRPEISDAAYDALKDELLTIAPAQSLSSHRNAGATRTVPMFQISFVDDAHCHGISFDVTNVGTLAHAIALILIQEFSLAKQLATGATVTDSTYELEQSEIDDIIRRRLRPVDKYHRDGFLFQLMMWLAAHVDLQDGDLVALPHSQGSAKGQDSLIVHRAPDAAMALSICEDKATENPRDTIREEVWPEIRQYESGGRRDELRSGIIATLGTAGVGTKEAEVLIRKISWKGNCRYRVRMSIEKSRSPKLFDGFADIVGGDRMKCRGETVQFSSLRAWMDDLARRVETSLRSFAILVNHV